VDETLRAGDIVVATEVRGPDGVPDGVVECPSAGILAAAVESLGLTARLGPVVCVDHVASPADRAALRANGALAVDMESWWLARAAARAPFAVLRVVVDEAGAGLFDRRTIRRGMKAYTALAAATEALAPWAAAAGERRILLAGPRSFCAGVDRAIEIVEKALERFGPPVYVRKQIVHNIHVVRDLEDRGAVFVDEIDEVPAGAHVVFSAHGVSPQVKAEAARRGHRVVDATCPLVNKVHAEARRFAGTGRTIFLIGHEGHEEVEGTTGEAPRSIKLIQNADDARKVEVEDPQNVSFLTQTTLSLDETGEVVDVLRERFPELTGPSSADICYATQNRQDALKAVVDEADVLFVVGSENSSNSKRLVEVSQRAGTPAFLIDDETHLNPQWLAGVGTVGLTAGASAPEELVWRVVNAIGGLGKAEVEERSVTTESIRFYLPKEVS
jgi:4-hydroxy-3-methylbut-2-enyl diphosphate reductase